MMLGSATPARATSEPTGPATLRPTYTALCAASMPGIIWYRGSMSRSSPSSVHLSFRENTSSHTAMMANPPPTTKSATLNISMKSLASFPIAFPRRVCKTHGPDCGMKQQKTGAPRRFRPFIPLSGICDYFAGAAPSSP